MPDDLEGLEKGLADTYYGNFSVFQSAPDHWAVKQLFPIMPLHRLNERPTRRGVFADLTCDSDGKMDHFIDLRDVKDVLELHPCDGKPYYMGMFLVGAYQEILGDLHNLFGDTNAVHVSLDERRLPHRPRGRGRLGERGARLRPVRQRHLVQRMRQANEEALRSGLLTFEESALLMRRFEEGLAGLHLPRGRRTDGHADRERRQRSHRAAGRDDRSRPSSAGSVAAAGSFDSLTVRGRGARAAYRTWFRGAAHSRSQGCGRVARIPAIPPPNLAARRRCGRRAR